MSLHEYQPTTTSSSRMRELGEERRRQKERAKRGQRDREEKEKETQEREEKERLKEDQTKREHELAMFKGQTALTLLQNGASFAAASALVKDFIAMSSPAAGPISISTASPNCGEA
ncbi:hypothetical protein EDD11_008132 [Mortierella claussenii]|nr:hypothetical protein EDD11_008132 [Mortierella claussenii]